MALSPTMALSNTQLIVLAAACQRPDRSIYPLTTKLPGGAAAKVLGSLLNKNLVKEVPAKRMDTLWREDKKRGRLTLRATSDAFKALGVDEAPADTEAPSSIEGKPELGGSRKGSTSKPKAHRADSKQAKLIEMLKRPAGASIDEIVTAFGWQAHTVRGAIAGALKKKLGLKVVSEKSEGRGRIYRIA
jgi:Protein of unknown function (DUF3489)